MRIWKVALWSTNNALLYGAFNKLFGPVSLEISGVLTHGQR